MEPFRQSMRPAQPGRRGEHPAHRTRRAAGAQSGAARRRAVAQRAGGARPGGQVADTLSQTENRIETLLVRALEQLKAMEDRNRVLEERAVAAETRAREAEKWLMRLHVEMEDKFTSWKGQQARGPRRPNRRSAWIDWAGHKPAMTAPEREQDRRREDS